MTPNQKRGEVKCGAGVPPSEYSDRGQDARATGDTLQKRAGRYLPHWTMQNAIYFVTFRLGDSLPASTLDFYRREKEEIICLAKQIKRELSEDELKRLDYLHSEKVEAFLDSGSGNCWMKRDDIAQVVQDALLFFDEHNVEQASCNVARASRPRLDITNAGKMPAPHDQLPPHHPRYKLHAWCVMPNHVHVVVEPLQSFELPDIIHSWKSFTAKQANRLLSRSGLFWQEEYYDHIIRNEADYNRVVLYTLENPIKAGLRNWSWVSKKDQSGAGVPPAFIISTRGQDARATFGGVSPMVEDEHLIDRVQDARAK